MTDVRTTGLNMIQELCFVNAYLDSGEYFSSVWREIFE